MKFFLLINTKMPTIVGILIFISRKNLMLSSALQEKSLNCWYLIFYKWNKFHSQLSWAWKKFFNLRGPELITNHQPVQLNSMFPGLTFCCKTFQFLSKNSMPIRLYTSVNLHRLIGDTQRHQHDELVGMEECSSDMSSSSSSPDFWLTCRFRDNIHISGPPSSLLANCTLTCAHCFMYVYLSVTTASTWQFIKMDTCSGFFSHFYWDNIFDFYIFSSVPIKNGSTINIKKIACQKERNLFPGNKILSFSFISVLRIPLNQIIN